MALMLRGGAKGGGGGIAGKSQILLKQVQIAESENLAEKWRQAKEEQERDRREMKKARNFDYILPFIHSLKI